MSNRTGFTMCPASATTSSSSVQNRRTISAAFLKLAAVGALLTPVASPSQMQTRPMVHNGYDRPYLLYRPAHLPPRPAVVFMLGGITSTAQSASHEFGWTEIADTNKFLVVFPEPVRTDLTRAAEGTKNITFWEMKGSRTHILAPWGLPVDDDGYLLAVLEDVLKREHADRNRVFFAGFSSGSGMVQLFAARHPQDVSGVVAVATRSWIRPRGFSSRYQSSISTATKTSSLLRSKQTALIS